MSSGTLARAGGMGSALRSCGGRRSRARPMSEHQRNAVLMIARLGGFLARKSDGEPGSEVLWRGFAELKIYAEAWKIFNHGLCG